MTLMRAALALLVVLVAAPLVNVFAAVPPSTLAAALGASDTLGAIVTSLVSSLASVLVATVLGVPAGYALARGNAAVRGAGVFVLALPLALPPVASGVAILGLVGTRQALGAWLAAHGIVILDSLAGVTIAEFFVSGSIVAIAATAAFSDVDRTFEEAARTLGARTGRVLWTIALPLAAPSIGAGILLAWLRAIGEYGATSIVAYHPTSLPIELVVALSADGVPRALALTEAFVALTAIVAAVAAIVRRRLV
ncbi:MAG: ABC transporter permease subunit [Candidatus Eremiobacteraeota bacterium]|nr:ABC transporter permease subunit [Candidatus Eremiobacteraeota bacterium]